MRHTSTITRSRANTPCLRTTPTEFGSVWPRRAGVVPTFRAATSEPWATRRTPGHGPVRVLPTLPARRPQQHPRLRTECGASRGRQAPVSLTAVLTSAAKGAVATIHGADARWAQLPHGAPPRRDAHPRNSRCIRTGGGRCPWPPKGSSCRKLSIDHATHGTLTAKAEEGASKSTVRASSR